MKLNSAEKSEIVVITINELQHPIAWSNKIKSLINSGLTEHEAGVEMILNPTVEMELYYDIGRGSFLVESEAVDNVEIYNPYSGAILKNASNIFIGDEKDSDIILICDGDLFDGTRLQFKDSFFTNSTNCQIIDWCKKQNWSLKINDKEII